MAPTCRGQGVLLSTGDSASELVTGCQIPPSPPRPPRSLPNFLSPLPHALLTATEPSPTANGRQARAAARADCGAAAAPMASHCCSPRLPRSLSRLPRSLPASLTGLLLLPVCPSSRQPAAMGGCHAPPRCRNTNTSNNTSMANLAPRGAAARAALCRGCRPSPAAC